MPLRAISTRPGWYMATGATTLVPLVGVPGVTMLPRVGGSEPRAVVPHNVLPLLVDDADAVRLRMPVAASDWEARNRSTVSRGFTPRTAQHSALDFIAGKPGILLGDSPRIGKTLTAIMAHDPASGPLLVVCPAMVRIIWMGWLRKVFPDEPIGMFFGRTYHADVAKGFKLIVGHYDIIAYWQSSTPIGTLIFDEAHALTNRRAKRSVAAAYLANKARRVICATGTPIWNMPPNLWNILTLIAPGAFGNFYEFANRYGKPVPSAHGTKYTGISNEAELQARLSTLMIRRRWIDIASDLPPITRNVVLVEMTDAKRRQLDLMVARLREAAGGQLTIGGMSQYREQVAVMKLPIVVEQAAQMMERDEPVVVWTWHRGLAEKVAEALEKRFAGRAFLLTGDVPNTRRDAVLAGWRLANASALVCTMSVAQVGLDFSHARLAIFGEIDYIPAVVEQSEMRTYDPRRPMNITYVIADHLVDQRIVLGLIAKLGAANPLGVGAANDAIEALRLALHGQPQEPDLERLLANILEGIYE